MRLTPYGRYKLGNFLLWVGIFLCAALYCFAGVIARWILL